MTKEQLTARLEKLWVQAANSCGCAVPQAVEEIQELERLLQEMEAATGEKPLESTTTPAR